MPGAVRQLDLFGREPMRFDERFERAERIDLGEGAWLDVVHGWLRGDGALFDELYASAPWRDESRVMYERTVDVPRRVASLERVPPIVDAMRASLDRRYATSFERMSAALYRDGCDSVAWHGDYVARKMDEALVATVSLGAPRKFLVRKTGGGPSRAFPLGGGDLVVMGGTCQRTHQHSIPKVAHAAPRIALMFRPVWE